MYEEKINSCWSSKTYRKIRGSGISERDGIRKFNFSV